MKVFGEIKQRYTSCQAPYTRIWKCGYRNTNKSPASIIEFIGAPFDIKETLMKFAKEKGIEVDPKINYAMEPHSFMNLSIQKYIERPPFYPKKQPSFKSIFH